jgi:hypothetical protein
MIGKHRLDRRLTCDTQRQRVKHLRIKSRDPLPQTKPGHDFTEISIQRTRPAQSVHTIAERRGDEFLKTADQADV